MGKSRRWYPPEFREPMIEQMRSERSAAELASEFEPTKQSILNWVRQADRDTGRTSDGMTTDERTELRACGAKIDARRSRDLEESRGPCGAADPARPARGWRARRIQAGRAADENAGSYGVSRREMVDYSRGLAPRAPDFVRRCSTAAGPSQLQVADITYIPTHPGMLYLVVILDVWSGGVIGWASGNTSAHDARACCAGHGR